MQSTKKQYVHEYCHTSYSTMMEGRQPHDMTQCDKDQRKGNGECVGGSGNDLIAVAAGATRLHHHLLAGSMSSTASPPPASSRHCCFVEIVHPDPPLPTHPDRIDCFVVSDVNPKSCGTLVRDLNAILPLPGRGAMPLLWSDATEEEEDAAMIATADVNDDDPPPPRTDHLKWSRHPVTANKMAMRAATAADEATGRAGRINDDDDNLEGGSDRASLQSISRWEHQAALGCGSMKSEEFCAGLVSSKGARVWRIFMMLLMNIIVHHFDFFASIAIVKYFVHDRPGGELRRSRRSRPRQPLCI
jgi:hypothetical protein